MPKLSEAKNIGPKTAQWLAEIGVETVEDLQQLGAVEVYRRVKASRPRQVSIVTLYALEGVLTQTHWNEIPAEIKAALRAEAEQE